MSEHKKAETNGAFAVVRQVWSLWKGAEIRPFPAVECELQTLDEARHENKFCWLTDEIWRLSGCIQGRLHGGILWSFCTNECSGRTAKQAHLNLSRTELPTSFLYTEWLIDLSFMATGLATISSWLFFSLAEGFLLITWRTSRLGPQRSIDVTDYVDE